MTAKKPAQKQTTLELEPSAEGVSEHGSAAVPGPGGEPREARESELSSDFAERFWKMEVDREAMKGYYLIHEHHARHLHWDLRLEEGGVLKSWALPKEPPDVPGVKRLAVEVEDHPLGYATFEGEVPAGNYGAGMVKIWDKGRHVPVEAKEGKRVFELKGQRLKGKYCLIRLKPRPGDKSGVPNWLFFRSK